MVSTESEYDEPRLLRHPNSPLGCTFVLLDHVEYLFNSFDNRVFDFLSRTDEDEGGLLPEQHSTRHTRRAGGLSARHGVYKWSQKRH